MSRIRQLYPAPIDLQRQLSVQHEQHDVPALGICRCFVSIPGLQHPLPGFNLALDADTPTQDANAAAIALPAEAVDGYARSVEWRCNQIRQRQVQRHGDAIERSRAQAGRSVLDGTDHPDAYARRLRQCLLAQFGASTAFADVVRYVSKKGRSGLTRQNIADLMSGNILLIRECRLCRHPFDGSSSR